MALLEGEDSLICERPYICPWVEKQQQIEKNKLKDMRKKEREWFYRRQKDVCSKVQEFCFNSIQQTSSTDRKFSKVLVGYLLELCGQWAYIL